MPYRLAITIAGAVSLGSFEAGVLFEVLDALGQHNDASSPDARIYIDVLTGASAGGMTAAIAAHRMLYLAGELTAPYDNVFYNTWVAGVDIDGLLPRKPTESPSQSVLSSDFVRGVAQKFLLGRYSGSPVPAPVSHPALNPQGKLRMGLALSNLNGLDFRRTLLSGGTFNYTEFADEITFEIGKTTDSLDAWNPVMNAAVACGAFPFAFRPCDVQRDIREFDSPFLAPWPTSPRNFTYTDGGVFQNQPIGLAKNLVDLIDDHQNSESRSYLFVSPQSVDPKLSGITAATAEFKAMSGAFINAVYSQAGFRDWIEAEGVNDAIKLLNRRASQLLDLFSSPALPMPAIQTVTELLLSQFKLPADDLVSARTQLRTQFASEYGQLSSSKGASVADLWIDVVLLFELAADLHEKDEMYIYSVTADRDDLAGAGFSSFLGFLDRSFRDHDYDLGRQKAQVFLASLHEVSQGKLPALLYNPQPIRPIAPTPPNGFSPRMISEQNRVDLADALGNAANNMLAEDGLAWIIRKAVEGFYIGRKINALLDLD